MLKKRSNSAPCPPKLPAPTSASCLPSEPYSTRCRQGGFFSPHGSAPFSTSANTSPCPSSATDPTPSLSISTGFPFTSTGAPLESSSTILSLPATQRSPEESTATPVGALSAPAPEPVNVFSNVPLGLYSSTSLSGTTGTYTLPAESAAICTSEPN